MGSGSFLLSHRAVSRSSYLSFTLAVVVAAAFVAGCGGSAGGSSGTGPTLSGYTAVTVLATSTANARLSDFVMSIEGVTLTSQSGKTVVLLSAPLYHEFIHLNGSPEPLVFTSIPQDVYTSATVTISDGEFTCMAKDPSSSLLEVARYSVRSIGPSDVTVTLPQPITVTGTSMGLLLNLLVSKSASFPSTCYTPGVASFSITPNFSITPVTISNQPTNSANGKVLSLHGQISSVTASSNLINVVGADGRAVDSPTWPFIVNSSTVFQGVTGISQLTAGMPVDMDVAIQQRGPMLATRVSVYDTDTTDLNIFTGPIYMLLASQPELEAYPQEQQGYLSQSAYYPSADDDISNAEFKISGALANLQSLPFTASFSAANMVPGQYASITTHVTYYMSGYPPAETVTLMPQTINGTVSAISTQGGFATYTVTLAPYDLFPVAANALYEVSRLTSPNTVVVYADSNAQKLTTNPIAVGSVVRFYGLVFNDNGTLRMDCAQINDGVAL